MAFVVVMETDRNHPTGFCQRHVTGAMGNLLYPFPSAAMRLKSQPVRPLFDTLKAKALMLDAGKNMSDLARALGYERQAVGHWFRGRGEPTVQQMKVMARELGCHWLELATEETLVVYREDERRRLERMRALDAASLAELDAFLAFQESKKNA